MNTSRIVPICALLISVIACIASLYQLRMASSSISAQTWPYVTIGWQHGNDKIGIVVDHKHAGGDALRYPEAIRHADPLFILARLFALTMSRVVDGWLILA